MIDKFAIAYQSVYGQWLPNSDYEPDDPIRSSSV
jgi:AraC family transcriptional regulator